MLNLTLIASLAIFAMSIDEKKKDLAKDPAKVDLKLATNLTIEAGKLAILTAETEAMTVSWDIPLGVDADEASLTTKRLVCTANPGSYVINCALLADGKIIFRKTQLIVTPPPGPPTPPVPPTPPDALTLVLQAAYTADAGTPDQKTTWKTALWSVYAAMGDHCDKLPATATVKDLLSDLQTSVRNPAILPDVNSLNGVRKAIALETGRALGINGAQVLDPVTRQAAKDLFKHVATSLQQVK